MSDASNQWHTALVLIDGVIVIDGSVVPRKCSQLKDSLPRFPTVSLSRLDTVPHPPHPSMLIELSATLTRS